MLETDNTIKFGGYHRNAPSDKPNMALCETGRGTPGGEYLRRFWHPIAYLEELGEVPLRVRALGEDLVAYRDGSGRVGVLHMQCCHRHASLEFAIVEKRGLRCCYHGRLFDADGTILEMPGESTEFQQKNKVTQGSYPTHVNHGIVFAYMGPPDRKPIFPVWDQFAVPGMTIRTGDRWALACNWLQIRENALDPAHTATLHYLPQYRGITHFAAEFGNFPDFLNWFETPGGIMYMAVRRVGENIWVRSVEALGPTYGGITTIFENGRTTKRATRPFLTFYLLPVDDFNSTRFYLNHIAPDEELPFEERRKQQNFAQVSDRPYHERQYLPGDAEALESQGAVNDQMTEHLGGNDRGVVMVRRYIRRGIEDVRNGKDPQGVYFNEKDLPPNLTNDFVMKASELDGDPRDRAVLKKFTERLLQQYLADPPLRHLINSQSSALLGSHGEIPT